MNFIKTRKIWYVFSILVLLFCVLSIFIKGFNVGIDFLGGTSTVLAYEDPKVELKNLRQALNSENVLITKIENNFIIKTKVLDDAQKKVFFGKLDSLGKYKVLESDFIGPSIGKQLQSTSLWIIGLAIILILVYITFRFEFAYALAAMIAELHDALFMIGMCSVLQLEVNITTVVAILTILGYSINDTIVVFDRIREEIKINKDVKKDLADIADYSIHVTLARSINTSFTVVLTILALYLFGGVTIREFALLLMIGVIDGTYSSIFIASPLMVGFKKMQA
jgi:preprotein translocase subunit SecF